MVAQYPYTHSNRCTPVFSGDDGLLDILNIEPIAQDDSLSEWAGTCLLFRTLQLNQQAKTYYDSTNRKVLKWYDSRKLFNIHALDMYPYILGDVEALAYT